MPLRCCDTAVDVGAVAVGAVDRPQARRGEYLQCEGDLEAARLHHRRSSRMARDLQQSLERRSNELELGGDEHALAAQLHMLAVELQGLQQEAAGSNAAGGALAAAQGDAALRFMPGRAGTGGEVGDEESVQLVVQSVATERERGRPCAPGGQQALVVLKELEAEAEAERRHLSVEAWAERGAPQLNAMKSTQRNENGCERSARVTQHSAHWPHSASGACSLPPVQAAEADRLRRAVEQSVQEVVARADTSAANGPR